MTGERERLKLMVIIASTRPVRVGLPVGTWFAGMAQEDSGWEVSVADLKELDLPMMNEPKHPRLKEYEYEHSRQWSAWVEAQDAFVVVFPEYNYTFTAPIKNAIDYLSQEWGHKPVGLVSYGGVSGGLRAAQQLKLPLSALKMMPLSEAVAIPSVSEHVQDGVFVPNSSATSSATTMLEQLRRWALALRPLRTGEL